MRYRSKFTFGSFGILYDSRMNKSGVVGHTVLGKGKYVGTRENSIYTKAKVQYTYVYPHICRYSEEKRSKKELV